MNPKESAGNSLPDGLLVQIEQITVSIGPALDARTVLDALKRAIHINSQQTGMPELAEQLTLNKLHLIIGALSLDEAIKKEVSEQWQQEVETKATTPDKLPRRTKKALQKKKAGKQLGPRELARLQALREQKRGRDN